MSNKVTHAYVCYVDDGEKLIVKISDIKAFKPENVEDYETTKKYKVLWCDGHTNKSNYYNASILLLGTSKKNIEARVKQMEKDLKSQNSNLSNLSSSDTDVSLNSPLAKKLKKSDPLEITDSTAETTMKNDEEKVTLKLMHEEIQILKNRVLSLENDNKILHSDVTLIKEEFEQVQRKSQDQHQTRNDDYSITETDTVNDLNTNSKKVAGGSYFPNDFLDEDGKDIQIFTIPAMDPSEMIDINPKLTILENQSSSQNCYNRYEKLMLEDSKTGIKVENIYLDKDIFISSESWDSIKSQKDDSKFVKNLAQAIWTRYELVNRSLDRSGASRVLNRSPRKILTPKKRQLIEDCFKDRLNEQQPGLAGKALEKVVKGSGRYLTELINDLIKRENKNSGK